MNYKIKNIISYYGLIHYFEIFVRSVYDSFAHDAERTNFFGLKFGLTKQKAGSNKKGYANFKSPGIRNSPVVFL